MKKIFNKKLFLNKNTITTLDHQTMGNIRGGYITYTCPELGCTTAPPYCTTGCPSINPRYCD